jgi:flagellar biosynthesis anti-sigma factor FlgM
MIIRDNPAGRVSNAYLRTLQTSDPAQREAGAREASAPERDEIGISAEAMSRHQMAQKAASVAADGEEVRWDKVNELRHLVSRGEYKTAAEDLARRLLGES